MPAVVAGAAVVRDDDGTVGEEGTVVERTGAGAVVAVVAVGPPGGSVGILMVGAVDGFGGKVIRTVSFFG